MWCLRTVQRAAVAGNNVLQVSQSSQEALKCSVLRYVQVRSHQALRRPSKVIFPNTENSLKQETVIELDRKGFPIEKDEESEPVKGGRTRSRVIDKSFSKPLRTSPKSLESPKPFKSIESSDSFKHEKSSKPLESVESPESSDSDSEEISKTKIEQTALLKKSIRSSIVLGKPTDVVFTNEGEVIYTKLIHKDGNMRYFLFYYIKKI